MMSPPLQPPVLPQRGNHCVSFLVFLPEVELAWIDFLGEKPTNKHLSIMSKETNMWKLPGLAPSGAELGNAELVVDEALCNGRHGSPLPTGVTQPSAGWPHFIDKEIGYFHPRKSCMESSTQVLGCASHLCMLLQCKWPPDLRVLWTVVQLQWSKIDESFYR